MLRRNRNDCSSLNNKRAERVSSKNPEVQQSLRNHGLKTKKPATFFGALSKAHISRFKKLFADDIKMKLALVASLLASASAFAPASQKASSSALASYENELGGKFAAINECRHVLL